MGPGPHPGKYGRSARAQEASRRGSAGLAWCCRWWHRRGTRRRRTGHAGRRSWLPGRTAPAGAVVRPARRPAPAAERAPLGADRGLGLEQAKKIIGHVGGPLVRGREHRLAGAGHAGQDQQAVRVHPPRGLDVGVEPVADHQRMAGPGPQYRLFVQRRLGLARDQRGTPGRIGDHLQQRAVAGLRPVRAGQRAVGVGPDEQRAGRDGPAALGQQRVADAGA